jgi:hypothetical protein
MPRALAKGCRTRARDRPQVVVRLDDEMFEEVRQRAEREKTSFGEQVRILVEWGLEAACHG